LLRISDACQGVMDSSRRGGWLFLLDGRRPFEPAVRSGKRKKKGKPLLKGSVC